MLYPTTIVSQDYGMLAKCLSAALQENSGSLKKQWIFVPNLIFKQWLLVQLANNSPSGCVTGYKICTVDELLYLQFPKMPTRLEMRCLIYQKLKTHLEKVELSRTMTDLFFSYGKYGMPTKEGWQKEIFDSIFESQFQLPLQFLPKAEFFTNDPCHFFGFSELPPVYWDYLLKSKGLFYLFSPCFHFWGDLRTDREQARFSRKTGLFDELSSSSHLLANLGKLGRDNVLDLEAEPVFASIQTRSNLGRLQKEIVIFEKYLGDKQSDESMKLLKTGASKIHEVETIAQEVLSLCNEKGLEYSDILIFAPDIQPYLPIVEYVFTKYSIPYRFPKKGEKSSFYQGVLCLTALLHGTWNADKIIALFELASFAKKMGLDEKEQSSWIQWTKEIFQHSSDWEKGFAELLKKNTTLQPGPLKEMISVSSFDCLEKLLEVFQSLQVDLCSQSKSLANWGKQIEQITGKYLCSDEDSGSFYAAIRNLKLSRVGDDEVPFEIVEDIFSLGFDSSCNGNHLHAVCLSSIEEGAIAPSRAILLLGMDEMSFPRKKQSTSLDIVKKAPNIADVDRYLFLQILLNVKDYLCISFSHISAEDGKQMEASIVVQELLDEWPVKTFTKLPSPSIQENRARFTFSYAECVESEEVLSLADLAFFSRNPWKYYLQKVEGIVLEERKERSFRALRSVFSRSSLDWPVANVFACRKERYPGIFQEAFAGDVEDKTLHMQKQLAFWGKKKSSLSFYQTAQEGEYPPIQIGGVKIIGDIPHCMEDGALHFGEDQISSLLRSWPETLAACIALQTPKIYFLKTGKMKTLSNAEEALKKFVGYYKRCQNTLSPLIPDWADFLLRNKEFSPEFDYEDEVTQWIYPRLEIPRNLLDEWKWLQDSFSELIELYPTRAYETV